MYKKLPKYDNLYINTDNWKLYRVIDGKMKLVTAVLFS